VPASFTSLSLLNEPVYEKGAEMLDRDKLVIMTDD
jgi:hypothetical protein